MINGNDNNKEASVNNLSIYKKEEKNNDKKHKRKHSSKIIINSGQEIIRNIKNDIRDLKKEFNDFKSHITRKISGNNLIEKRKRKLTIKLNENNFKIDLRKILIK